MISQEHKLQSTSVENVYININFKNIVFIGCGILSGLISLLPVTTNSGYFILKLLQEILFLMLGIAYIISLKKDVLTSRNLNMKKYPIYLTLIYCVVLTVLYFLFKRDLWFMSLSSSVAFILPFCMSICWIYFLAIPDKEYKIWVPKKITSNTASLFLDSIFIKIKIARKQDDVIENIYSVYAPHYTKLGDFFSRFISNQNHNKDSVIEETDNSNERFAWQFFITDLYGLQIRRLDPNLSLADNKIKQAAIINIRRVKQPR